MNQSVTTLHTGFAPAIFILLLAVGTSHAQNPAVTVTVDAALNRRPINPHIYGIAHATASQLSDLNSPLNRNGGNNTSRYNWQINADNRANDWYYESIPEASAVAGARGDSFIAAAKTAGAEAMLTIPTIGWVAKLGPNRGKLASFSVAKYGAQTGNDWQWFPDAGNGIWLNGQPVSGNDPNDANVPSSSTFQQGWVQHLVSRWGTAGTGGLRFYILDNEPSIWHSTHRDVHPVGATMEEVRDKMLDYAGKIKSVDASALVVGPEEWGWSGYIFSGYDQQWGSQHGWSNLPDRQNHGGWDYLPWLLNELRQQHQATGRRLLDVFSVHFYPQGGEFSNDTSTSMQLRRNRSTRALWDPNYVDETWINDRVRLIPRLKSWTATYYPGTPVAITEYNWGAENHISGAIAQADIFGIFGREGLDLAARWTTPDPSTPTYKAMKLYRNYDGNKSTFGDTSVSASVPNPDNVAAFASVRESDGALTIMVLNKYLSGNTPLTVSLANFTPSGTVSAWRLTAANTITQLPDVTISGASFNATLPQQSITLFVLPPSGVVNQPPLAVASASPISGIAPLSVAFDGRQSSDPDGTVASYAWTFGDGASSAGATTTHTYQSPGTYQATLTVTDDLGSRASSSLSIQVTSDPNLIAAPSNLSASAGKSSVSLRWTDNSSNEQGFYVERATASTNPAFIRVGTVGASATQFSQTVSRGTYVYRVQAFNLTTGRVSAYSNQVQVRAK